MRKAIRAAALLIAAVSVLYLSGCGNGSRASRYEQAAAALDSGAYAAAAEAFEALGDYKDSPLQAETARAQAEAARQLAEKQAAYETALALAGSGSYAEAAELFLSLGDYLDSAGQAEKCRQEAVKASYARAVSLFEAGDYEQATTLFLQNPEYGDTDIYLKALELYACETGGSVLFGNYMQASQGAEPAPIEWRVLAKDGSRVLLLSEQGLDRIRFHERLYPFWADSELRQWLNSSFFSTAFTPGEQQLIELSALTTPGYSSWLGLYMGGPDTEDAVFLLSKEELAELLSEEAERVCTPSAYALSKGAQTDESGACLWWTRSPGNHHGKISLVDADGGLNPDGRVNFDFVCVRPAIWVNIRNLTE